MSVMNVMSVCVWVGMHASACACLAALSRRVIRSRETKTCHFKEFECVDAYCALCFFFCVHACVCLVGTLIGLVASLRRCSRSCSSATFRLVVV